MAPAIGQPAEKVANAFLFVPPPAVEALWNIKSRPINTAIRKTIVLILAAC